MNAKHAADFLRVNGLIGDPAVYAFFQKTGAAVLFDAGALDRLPNRDLLRIRYVLVSHTHIDHFYGFDRLVRVNIPHRRSVTVVGPTGIIRNVQGKLRGYLWNLLGPDAIDYTVHEVDAGGRVTSARLRNGTDFEPEPVNRPPVAPGRLDPPLLPPPVATFDAFGDGSRFEAVALDHKTLSLAYACQLPARLSVRTDVLAREGLQPGPWIRELQMAVTSRDHGRLIEVGGRRVPAGELGARLFETSTPRPLAYLTDVGFTRANLERIVPLVRGVQTFICETNYRDADVAKASDRMHLTTRQAALIAAAAAVGTLEIFHVSNLYVADPQAVVDETAGFFARFRALDQAALAHEIAAELQRVEAAPPQPYGG